MKKIRVFNFAIFACLVSACLFMAGCQGLSGDPASGSTSDGSSSGTTPDGSSSGDTSSNGGTTADANGSSITYGWDATTTTYRVDPSKVVGNGMTVSVDTKTGYLTVSAIGEYGQLLIPFATTDTQFMGQVTKVTLKLTSSASGTKKVAWKVSNSTADSWGTGGANQLDAQYQDYKDDWASTEHTIYFNGSDANFKALSSYTSPAAVAFCNNGGGSDVSALTDASFVVESIVFSK
jgi:hypothetical protein